jgi:UDP-N-acetylmuramate--alanine ligase
MNAGGAGLAALRVLLDGGPRAWHLVGIGGVGMAGLARLLHQAGHRVSGSDLHLNAWTDRLAAAGVTVHAGHRADGVPPAAEAVIRSAAVGDDNPEIAAAHARGVSVFRRGEALAALANARDTLAIAGTHGKTTTTAMTAWALRQGGIPAGYALGGESAQLGEIAETGACPWLVAEADESDGTLAHHAPRVGLIANLEFDHAEHFADEAALRACYAAFWRQAAARVVCLDDPGARRLALEAGLPFTGYGFSSDAEVRGESPVSDARGARCRVEIRGRPLGRLHLPVPGRHNLQNALGALALAVHAGLSPEAAREALATFRPVARRFEILLDSPARLVVSDYAHHPTEIRTVVEMARALGRRRLVMLYEPHRPSRTARLGPDFPPAFAGVDHLVLAPVYAASEPPVPGGDAAALAERVRTHGSPPVEVAASLDQAWDLARAALRPGDALLLVGAGEVHRLAARARETVAF